MRRLITLTTDFGLSDPYVGAVKGVILSINPDAVIVDITHHVQPQRIEQGAFLLECAIPHFPPDAIHIAVVDPGVGTERLALAVSTPTGVLVGPDNGLLSTALPDSARKAAGSGAARVPLPPYVSAFRLTEERFHRRPVSSTFHGRDIFAPVAAHLSLGVEPQALGPRAHEIVALPPFQADERAAGVLEGRVLHIDRFGNVVTNVRAGQLRSSSVEVEVSRRPISGLVTAYGERSGLVALIGSSGYLEIALSGGNAARELGAALGDPIIARPA